MELENGNFKAALSAIDDLDGVLGNKMFTKEMLASAEWISLQKAFSSEKGSVLRRMKVVIESKFWKDLLAKKKIDNPSMKNSPFLAEA